MSITVAIIYVHFDSISFYIRRIVYVLVLDYEIVEYIEQFSNNYLYKDPIHTIIFKTSSLSTKA